MSIKLIAYTLSQTMNDLKHIYNDNLIANLDPIKDKKEILARSDLDWKYEVKPLFYYNTPTEIVLSGSKQLLINRNGVMNKVAVRGEDFHIISIDDLYDVFLTLKEPLNLSLYAIGHTREGKFIYIVAEMVRENKVFESDLGFRHCIIIHTVNDGNGKTKISPVWLKNDEIQYQLSVIGGEDKKGEPLYLSTCYEISHHFKFDSLEAAIEVKDIIEERNDDFEDRILKLNEIGINEKHIEEFHHRIYSRFEIGNEKTKVAYSKITKELTLNYEKFNKKLPIEYRGSLFSLYLAFISFIDTEKKRKLGKNGRITSINFTHDNVTKRVAFEEIFKVGGVILNEKSHAIDNKKTLVIIDL
ncbi:hypothetical protein QTV49_000290 [Vibrio vulnificus]|nr:hypothetical protein [Vibrio vulnificus]